MTVKDLMDLLVKCPATAEVLVPGPNGFERTPEGRFEMHHVQWVCSTGWTPLPGAPARACVVLSRDELPLPGDRAADEPTGLPN